MLKNFIRIFMLAAFLVTATQVPTSASVTVRIENQTGMDIVSLRTTFFSNGAGQFELLKDGEIMRNNFVLPVVWGDNQNSKTMYIYGTFQNGTIKYLGELRIKQDAKIVLR